jgi:uncharacterized repeat protein (TIGR03803 family)
MKSKLLFAFSCIMLAATVYTSAQQIWAVTPQGGTYGGGAIVRMNPDGSGFSVEYSYQCSASAGCMPMGNLIQASDGQLYGTCFLGGPYASCTVDRFDPATGTYTMVYGFDITNGDYPRSGLIDGHNGKLYGAASAGGTSYMGVIYSINMATNAYTPEYSFDSPTGSSPYSCPIMKSGMLYGLTTSGGTYGNGVLYSYIIATGTYTALHHFSTADGTSPKGALIEASNGLFYGMTSGGGANSNGTIFSYDPINNVFTVLYSFTTLDGSGPEGTFMQAADAKLYAVTKTGGANTLGTLFSYDITQNVFTKLYDFVASTGSNPTGDLYQSSNQVLYGSAYNGGASNDGVLFSYDLSTSTYTDLLDFNGTNGSHPAGGFVMVEMPTGISSITQPSFSVYPNPANEEINIGFVKASHRSIALRNVTGEIVYSTENSSLQQHIDISKLPRGIYMVEIKEDSGKILNQKIVKM